MKRISAKRLATLSIVGCLFVSSTTRAFEPPDPKAPYLDTSLTFEARTKDLISRLTLEEKATLLDHVGPDVTRFDIKADRWNQCLHGVWWDRPTTMFPISIALAATWDTDLVHEEADIVSDEARAIYNGWHIDPNAKGEHKGLIYRSPVINVSRNPYWGRINECFGEDPYLTGRLGVAFVEGLQGDDPRYLKLVSTLKHFAVNNVEKNRKALSATVNERMLYEFWLPHFRDCIVEGHAQSIMASYNAINGTPNNMNSLLLTDILKKQWGFDGFVVSDLGGVNTMVTGHEKGQMSYDDAVAKSMLAGCDFSDKEFRMNAPSAVKAGLLPEARLDDAVYRVMRDRFRLGEFDPPAMVPFSKISPDVIGSKEHIALALKVAQKSIVLLTNKNNFLPLDKTKIKSIAVIGPHANIFTAGGYSGKPMQTITPMQGIQNRAQKGTEVVYAQGGFIQAPRNGGDAAAELAKAVDAAKKADVAIVFVGTNIPIEGEGHDRATLALPGNQEALVEAVIAANPRTVVVEMNAGPLTVPWIIQNAPAVVEAWWGGEQGANAMADVLFGDANPGGKMPLTVYASEAQVPPQDEYDVTKGFTYLYLKGKPLIPFGHGLSYTEFAYSNLKLSADKIQPGTPITVTVDIENTGKVAGDEVPQLYTHQVQCSVQRPAKELRGFKRVTLNPGEKKTVTFTVPYEKLAFYDVKTHCFIVEPGAFEIMVGSSSEDIRGTGRFEVVAVARN